MTPSERRSGVDEWQAGGSAIPGLPVPTDRKLLRPLPAETLPMWHNLAGASRQPRERLNAVLHPDRAVESMLDGTCAGGQGSRSETL
jgi:hypothetical protein